ncbi:hypothetical protein CJO66_16750 [Burkholderia ubonensis]|uniref:Uncharacterized protein n=1 Tax=Burkholderia ubonensis TaxID=101571 RepID=A0AB74D1J7_9BURK|nr:hypothetical protein CJO71_15205 [Burkholderia ubonensis]PAJ85468.1 hypothetical protein CJO70_22650 [Burkholderia ubonensis]PAJ92927.1 hypothetical protein CJO69_19425 [Burkholderia ubonensis]PAJ99733.1 hypothetical protein CJO68_18300 [Burkholderia ubonensis]PAK06207.1 hypothetical protein CJO67_19710 [Burkholderia ubonensis]
MGYVSAEFEDGFDRPIENFMWKVIIFVISARLRPGVEKAILQSICDQISTEGLHNLLQDVPPDEAELFTHDLRILKFIQ